ncbi:MAG: MarR family transcriptional regulator [Pseudomonadota bacterium]
MTVTPKDIVSACRRLYDAIDKLDAVAANRVQVSRNDLRCLNLLSKGPAKPGYIATELDLTTGSVTTLLDRLEAKNLLRRDRDPHDRRGVLVYPTDHLFTVLGPLYLGVAEEIERLARDYTPKERVAAARHLSDAAMAYDAAINASKAND